MWVPYDDDTMMNNDDTMMMETVLVLCFFTVRVEDASDKATSMIMSVEGINNIWTTRWTMLNSRQTPYNHSTHMLISTSIKQWVKKLRALTLEIKLNELIASFSSSHDTLPSPLLFMKSPLCSVSPFILLCNEKSSSFSWIFPFLLCNSLFFFCSLFLCPFQSRDVG